MTTQTPNPNLKVPLPEVITAAWLERLGACPTDRREFAREWPDGAAVTWENFARASALGLDVEWLAETVLIGAAWAEYERVTGAARAECERVTGAARAEYERVRGAAIYALLTGSPATALRVRPAEGTPC